MAARCHFAHGKEELRTVHDALPPNTPYISDPKTKKPVPNQVKDRKPYGKGQAQEPGKT
jgi:hypothetical protein